MGWIKEQLIDFITFTTIPLRWLEEKRRLKEALNKINSLNKMKPSSLGFRYPNRRHTTHHEVFTSQNRLERSEMTSFVRQVAYCINSDCENFTKGIFLLGYAVPEANCPRCREPVRIKRERGIRTGVSPIFTEVRLEFDYDPVRDIFGALAIVRDDSVEDIKHSTYTFQTPMVKTDNRALKMAESILSSLNLRQDCLNANGLPQTTERILSFDDSLEIFTDKCKQLQKELKSSSLYQGHQ